MERLLARVSGALAAPRAAWERFWWSSISPSLAGALPVDAVAREAQPYALPDTSIVFAVPKRKVRPQASRVTSGRGSHCTFRSLPRR